MILPEDSRFAFGLCSNGSPQVLYELEDGTRGFLGHDLRNDQLVEIHRLPAPNAMWQQHFDSILERLAQAEKLRHPNLACILDSGEDADDHQYYVTEFVEGERLRIWLERVAAETGPVPQPIGLSLTLQLADLVAFLANRPRLLSSINLDDFAVSLDRGQFLQIRLTDFGFDREENPIRDTELAARWIQTTALLLQHLLDGTPLPDPEVLLDAANEPMVEGPLRALVTDLHERADSVAFGELLGLKGSLIRATEHFDSGEASQSNERKAIANPVLVPRGPLYALMRESPELGELADGRWQTVEDPGPDGCSPFTLRAKVISESTNPLEGDSNRVDLEFLPPERLVDNGVIGRITEKMQHPYLKKHPGLVRTRSMHSETDFALVANESLNGFSLMSLVARRGRLNAAEVCHLARQLDRLLTHLDDATAIHYGGLDPWRVLVHFHGDPSPELLHQRLTLTPVTEWSGAELRLRIENITDALVEPSCSSWRYLLESRLNRKRLSALALWMHEAERFDRLLSENRAGNEPLSHIPEIDALFRTAATHLDETNPAQRQRFLEMLEAGVAELRPDAPGIPDGNGSPGTDAEPAKPPRQKRSGLFRRQRTMLSPRR